MNLSQKILEHYSHIRMGEECSLGGSIQRGLKG
jgi:hypothetical protein